MTLKHKFVFPLVVYLILYAITVPFFLITKEYLIPDALIIIHKIAVILAFLFLIIKYIKDKKELFKAPKLSGRVLTLVLFVGSLFAINNYFLSNYSLDYSYLDKKTTILSLLVISRIISSTAEEVMYRGFMQSYINQSSPSNTKMISQGNWYATFFFFLGHIGFYTVMDPVFATTSLLLVFFFSLSMGYIRDKTGSLIWPIIIHILCNIVHLAFRLQHYS